MKASPLPHIWSKEAFFVKAQRYASIMLTQDRSNWQFGLWSVLTLEMLARAVVANVSPTLVADGRDWNNIYFALGHKPNASKFSPKSVDISEILLRIESTFPDFTREMVNFSVAHITRRNEELHSGALPFDDLGTSAWLPMYYLSSKTLLTAIGEDLIALVGKDEKKVALKLIASLKDEAAKAVGKKISAHKTVWADKGESEKKKLAKEAEGLATRHIGHRVSCPACGSRALVHGHAAGAANSKIEDGIIVERQPMLPSRFECFACGLKITGYSKLLACGLGDTFTSTNRYEAVEYFGIESEEDRDGWDDFNEY